MDDDRECDDEWPQVQQLIMIVMETEDQDFARLAGLELLHRTGMRSMRLSHAGRTRMIYEE
jgi:hypothetical protein